MSMPSNVARTPKGRLAGESATSAACSSALVGMQPAVQAGAAELVLLDEGDAHPSSEARSAQA
jgi:hypothetical protein